MYSIPGPHGESSCCGLKTSPYFKRIQPDLRFSFDLVNKIHRPLEDPDEDIEIRLWFKDLKNNMEDIMSVCSVLPGHVEG